jgi:hypothetical protein
MKPYEFTIGAELVVHPDAGDDLPGFTARRYGSIPAEGGSVAAQPGERATVDADLDLFFLHIVTVPVIAGGVGDWVGKDARLVRIHRAIVIIAVFATNRRGRIPVTVIVDGQIVATCCF